jgi:hypothetical protein
MTDWNAMEFCARGEASFMETWVKIVREGRDQEQAWIDELRARGFKAAHPNDGWVDRERSILTFCYPQFDSGAGAGDLVMLGWASDPKSWRPVMLTEDVSTTWLGYNKKFRFIDAPTA